MPLNEFSSFEGKVNQWPERTRTVRNRVMTVPRAWLVQCEDDLAKAARCSIDNHVVYGLTSTNGNKFYIMFHDGYAIFGFSVEDG